MSHGWFTAVLIDADSGDWGDTGVAIAIFIICAAIAAALYGLMLVLSYGYYTWKELIFKKRRRDVKQSLAAYVFISLVIITTILVSSLAEEMLLSTGNHKTRHQDLLALAIVLGVVVLVCLVCELMARKYWMTRRPPP